MTFREIVVRAEKLVMDNSPGILTGIGVVGTLTTAYFSGKASFKAGAILADERVRKDMYNMRVGITDRSDFTLKESVTLVWKEYIPAVGTGIITVACIICANRIGTRRAAAMAAAYSISQEAFVEYKEKVLEKIGQNKEQAVRDEIAQDRVAANPVGKTEVIVTGGGEVLCYDMYTGRYFHSSIETLKKAQNDINYTILNNFYASLSDFYNKIGLSNTKTSDDVGWNSDKMLELMFSTTMSDDDRPCIAVDFAVAPIRDFYRIH